MTSEGLRPSPGSRSPCVSIGVGRASPHETRRPACSQAPGGADTVLISGKPARRRITSSKRDFHAHAPNDKRVTDISEAQIPARKVSLSPMIDCFDGMIVSGSMGTGPDAKRVTTMVGAAIETVTEEDKTPIVHCDRGGHYRWSGRISRRVKAMPSPPPPSDRRTRVPSECMSSRVRTPVWRSRFMPRSRYGRTLCGALRRLVVGLQYSVSTPIRFMSACTRRRPTSWPSRRNRRAGIYAPANGNSMCRSSIHRISNGSASLTGCALSYALDLAIRSSRTCCKTGNAWPRSIIFLRSTIPPCRARCLKNHFPA